jgi:chemotaxis protein CheD
MPSDDPAPIDVFLQPGELFVADAGFRIRTLLGSCVSITLWHPGARVGGMSHFLLPQRGGHVASQDLDGRYGDEALLMMMRELRQAGVSPAQCQAKVFGGGNMFPGYAASRGIQIGQRNGEAARQLLQAHDIPVVSESLFGDGHRQVIFEVRSGDVWLNQVRPTSPERDPESLSP